MPLPEAHPQPSCWFERLYIRATPFSLEISDSLFRAGVRRTTFPARCNFATSSKMQLCNSGINIQRSSQYNSGEWIPTLFQCIPSMWKLSVSRKWVYPECIAGKVSVSGIKKNSTDYTPDICSPRPWYLFQKAHNLLTCQPLPCPKARPWIRIGGSCPKGTHFPFNKIKKLNFE